jgi:hypothetical protein
MRLISTATGKIIEDERLLDKDDRKDLKDANPSDLYRDTCVADHNSQCIFKLSADLRFYPISRDHRQFRHAEDCSRSAAYTQSEKYNMAFHVIGDTGDIVARMTQEKAEANATSRSPADEGLRKYPEKGTKYRRITFEGFCRKFLMLAYNTASEKNRTMEKDTILGYLYNKSKHIHIGEIDSPTIHDINHSFSKEQRKFETLQYGWLNEVKFVAKTKERSEYYEIDYQTKYRTEKAFLTTIQYRHANRAFVNTYTMAIPSALEAHLPVMFFGWQFEKYGWSDPHRTSAFIVCSNLGCFSESALESRTYTQIERILHEKYSDRAYLSKPWEYGYGPYENKFLEDGVIIPRSNSRRRIILEMVDGHATREEVAEKIRLIKKHPERYQMLLLTGADKNQLTPESVKKLEDLLLWLNS